MKILHVTQGYSPAIGGTELLIQRVSEELTRQFDDQVTVYTTNCYGGDAFHAPWLPVMPANIEVINHVTVRRFETARWQSLASHVLSRGMRITGMQVPESLRVRAEGPLIPGFKKEISEAPADIIAASSFPLMHMFDAVEGAQLAGKPCVLQGGIHPRDTWGFDRIMIDRAIKSASHYIAYTRYEADYVIYRGADPGRVTVIGVGVDPEPFLKADGAAIRSQFGLHEGPVIGFIGQFTPHKGPDLLLQAMTEVWKKEPDAQLILAGARRKFARRLESMISQLEKKDRDKIRLIYDFPAEMKPGLYAALDVFVYPSLFESFGIAFLEAWAAGKPVIGFNTGAIPWVVTHLQDGLLVGPGNVHELSEALITLIRDPALCKKLGQNGRHKTLARFTWPEIARRFRSVYNQVIEKV
jgi:glycosyltransferase involved in cell wall biosynthesis